MNQYVKMSIDGRRQAIEGAFDLDEASKKKVEELFKEIEKMGTSCKDASEFETKFQASPLNQKYTDLFTEIATSSAGKQAAKQTAASMAGGVAQGIARNALGGVIPTRASVNQAAYDGARRVPVLGDAIDIGQKASYVAHLGKVFGIGKKKKDKKDER